MIILSCPLFHICKVETYSDVNESRVFFALQRKAIITNYRIAELNNYICFLCHWENWWGWHLKLANLIFLKAESVDQTNYLCLRYKLWSFSIYTQIARVDVKINVHHEKEVVSFLK